jgi:anti-sigma regulatory factor (Ser/Thr protein kinase)
MSLGRIGTFTPSEPFVSSHPIGSCESISLTGGTGAPGRARDFVLKRLCSRLSEARTADAALIVSELVTNSVRHTDVSPGKRLQVELTTIADGLRIAVTDAGTQRLPRLLPFDPASPGGFGLWMVQDLTRDWGVERDSAGTTCVWCDLVL